MSSPTRRPRTVNSSIVFGFIRSNAIAGSWGRAELIARALKLIAEPHGFG